MTACVVGDNSTTVRVRPVIMTDDGTDRRYSVTSHKVDNDKVTY